LNYCNAEKAKDAGSQGDAGDYISNTFGNALGQMAYGFARACFLKHEKSQFLALPLTTLGSPTTLGGGHENGTKTAGKRRGLPCPTCLPFLAIHPKAQPFLSRYPLIR